MTFINKLNDSITTTLYSILLKLYGLGKSSVKLIMSSLKLPSNIILKKLSKNRLIRLQRFLNQNSFFVKNEPKYYKLKRLTKLNELPIFRTIQFKRHLPIRGQRTRTNARTAKSLNK